MRADGREPTQLEIETHMIGLDHVKKLANEIEAEGGLHDAVIVRGGTMEVLEGNRRLAAYRLPRKAFERCQVGQHAVRSAAVRHRRRPRVLVAGAISHQWKTCVAAVRAGRLLSA